MANWSADLVAGWNIIVYGGQTIPIEQLVITPLGALGPIWYYDNQTQKWQGYDPSAPAWANDLKTMENGKSYQINFNQAGQISSPGVGSSPLAISPVIIILGIILLSQGGK